MFASPRRSRAPRATGAFTLIEIVMVLAVLAAVSGLVIVSMHDSHEQTSLDLARIELNEVRKAVLQFRADTGHLPKRGPFNLDAAVFTGDRSNDHGRVQLAFLPAHLQGGVLTTQQQIAWFDEPANLWQLFECPFSSDDPLASWDPARRRGWRGPYLTRTGEGRLVASRLLATNGLTTWSAGDTVGYFAAGFGTFPVVLDSFVRQSRDEDDPQFKYTPSDGSVALAHGRPIVIFDLDPFLPGPGDDVDNGIDRVAELARIVSFGPDGVYDALTQPNDDITVHLLR